MSPLGIRTATGITIINGIIGGINATRAATEPIIAVSTMHGDIPAIPTKAGMIAAVRPRRLRPVLAVSPRRPRPVLAVQTVHN